MKISALIARIAAALSLIWLGDAAALAQLPTTGSPTGLNSAFVKLFESVGPFSAKVDTQVFDPAQNETVRMPMSLAALNGHVRLEINLSEMKSKDMTPATLAKLKQAGMDRIVSVFRPDKNVTYVIYPGIQSYQTIPLAKGEAEAQKGLKVEKSQLGKATLDGHHCVKNKVTITGEKGVVLEATTWNATDLKDFPVQIEMHQKRDTVRMHFTQIRLTKPDAKEFDLPPTYGRMQ